MKKQLLLSALLTMSIPQLFAQSPPPAAQVQSSQVSKSAALPRWTLFLSGGGAFPMGKFGAQQVTDSTSSFAKAGPLISFTVDYRISSQFGLSLILSGQENKTDNKAIASKMEGLRPDVEYAVNVATWKIGRALAGAWIETPLDQAQKWRLQGRLAAGILFTKLPKTIVTAGQLFPGGGPLVTEISQISIEDTKSLMAFAWQAGGRLNYSLTSHWTCHLDASYSCASLSIPAHYHPGFEHLGSTGVVFGTTVGPGSIPPPPPPPAINNMKLPINTIDLSAGVGFRL